MKFSANGIIQNFYRVSYLISSKTPIYLETNFKFCWTPPWKIYLPWLDFTHSVSNFLHLAAGNMQQSCQELRHKLKDFYNTLKKRCKYVFFLLCQIWVFKHCKKLPLLFEIWCLRMNLNSYVKTNSDLTWWYVSYNKRKTSWSSQHMLILITNFAELFFFIILLPLFLFE